MKLDKFRSPRPLSIVLVLVLSILGFAVTLGPIHIVHAVGPQLVQTAQSSSGLCDGGCLVTFPKAVTAGDFLFVHAFCMIGGGVSTVTDNTGNTYTNILTNSRGTIWETIARSTSTGAVTVTFSSCNFSGSPGGAYSWEEFSGVGSIGNTANNNAATSTACGSACTNTLTINLGTNNALIYEALDDYGSGLSSCPTVNVGGSSQILTQTLLCLNGLAGAWSIGMTDYAANRGIGLNSFTVTASAWTQVGHELVELDPPGGTPSNIGTQTACFGNCGNPAITLVNTNSTHTVNFNASIELFYSFQSNLNGQVVNITANVAKTYGNGNSLVLGVYTIPSCGAGQPPFSPICPAALQKSTTIQNPLKGMNTFSNLAIPVSNGQWVGFAFTATFSGMDLNDTNTAVPISQASDGGGALNPTISQSTVFSAVSKIGLWGYITGNTITGIPPPPTTGAATCSGLLDCILPSLVFSFCSNQTPQCQNASALAWAMILTIITLFFVFRTTGNLMPGVRVPIGEAFTLALIVWIFILSGLQLLFVWVPLFFFFIAAIIFGKKTGTFL